MKTIHKPGLVSIALPAYNVEQVISTSIESVLAQTYADWELIIVNDGSWDQTAIQAARYSDPRIKLIHQYKSGEATAYNTALRHMQGEFISFIAAGDIYLPQHLELGIAEFSASPEIDGLIMEGVIRDDKENIRSLQVDKIQIPADGYIFADVIKSNRGFDSASGFILRRSLVTRFQLQFDPDIHAFAVWDFLIQFSELGRFGSVSGPTYHTPEKSARTSHLTPDPQLNQSLARCREKAIKLDAFPKLEVATRSQVLDELLVSLLSGNLHRQDQVSHSPEFSALPVSEQARMLRRIAIDGLMHNKNNPFTEIWLARAQELCPADRHNAYPMSLYRFNPWLLRASIYLRNFLHLKLS